MLKWKDLNSWIIYFIKYLTTLTPIIRKLLYLNINGIIIITLITLINIFLSMDYYNTKRSIITAYKVNNNIMSPIAMTIVLVYSLRYYENAISSN